MAVVAGRLTRLWETSPSIVSWLTTVDHKAIGRRYIYTAYLYLIAAGLAALTMRTQLIKPNNTFLSPETYNQIFTVHGTTMIF